MVYARGNHALVFNPLHVQSSGAVTEADIDALELFRFSTHPKISLMIQEMKTEITKYNAIINSIKPLPQRRDAKGNDTFTLLSFWRANEGEVPAFSSVLRAVLANAPNSIPPERVFSVLNDTFDDDMGNSRADYIELSLQLQFNDRSR